jgi:hypothetical protein
MVNLPGAVLHGGNQQFAFVVHKVMIGFQQVNEFRVEGHKRLHE